MVLLREEERGSELRVGRQGEPEKQQFTNMLSIWWDLKKKRERVILNSVSPTVGPPVDAADPGDTGFHGARCGSVREAQDVI